MKHILVLGYGWTGSSAVVDLLKEYDSVSDIPIEFRLIKDPGGLMDLRYNLVDRWDPLNVDIAVKKFIWHNSYLNKKKTKIPPRYGLGYSEFFGEDFIKVSNDFVGKICNSQYFGDWFYFHYKNSFQIISKKIKAVVLRKKYGENMYYSNISGSEFDRYAKDYINSIFEKKFSSEFLILDQAVPAQTPLEADHYFDNYYIIIVDRDPRDNYCDLVKSHGLIGNELAKNDNVEFFRDWFLRNRENIIKNKSNIKYINFENLVYDYENTKNELERFLDLKSSNHIDKLKFFNPENSKKNIGIWKEYNNQGAIEKIKEMLPDYINNYAE